MHYKSNELVNLITRTAFKDITYAEKAILQIFASFADPDGTHAYPSTKTLVKLSLFSRRKVFYILKSLRKKGYLIYSSHKHLGLIEYSINLSMLSIQPMGGAKHASPPQKAAIPNKKIEAAENKGERALQPMGGAKHAPNPNTNIIYNNNIYNNTARAHERPEQIQEGFKEYWDLHPRKMDAKKSFWHYCQALKVATHDEIMKKLRAYKRKIYATNTPDKYVKSSFGWLSDARWLESYGKYEVELASAYSQLVGYSFGKNPYGIVPPSKEEWKQPSQAQMEWISDLLKASKKPDKEYQAVLARKPKIEA